LPGWKSQSQKGSYGKYRQNAFGVLFVEAKKNKFVLNQRFQMGEDVIEQFFLY
jgi:hypothetical protein